MKTLIAVPCMDSVAIEFAQSLAILDKVGECVLSCNVGSLISESREKLALRAIQMECDQVMWFDSDMQFAPDTLSRMLKHMETKDIVTGLYFRRVRPFTPVLFKKLDFEGDNCRWEGYDDYPSEPFTIEGAGFGCMCTKTTVLMDCFAKYGTCFSMIGNNGEDVSFSRRARERGYEIWCDPTIKCGHVARMVITEDFYKSIGHQA